MQDIAFPANVTKPPLFITKMNFKTLFYLTCREKIRKTRQNAIQLQFAMNEHKREKKRALYLISAQFALESFAYVTSCVVMANVQAPVLAAVSQAQAFLRHL